MVKKSTWITGLTMILVAVLAVGVFCAPEATAAEINYGSANLPAGVQEQIDAAAQMRANAASFITESKCPLCDGTVEWTQMTGNIASKANSTAHYYLDGELTLDSNGWPIDICYSNSGIHLILTEKADLKLIGSIWVGFKGAQNVELAIMGSGKITSTGAKAGNGIASGAGLFWIRGENTKLILNGGTYTYTYGTQNNETALITTYGVTGGGQIDIYDGTVIGPETMSTTVDAYNVHLTNTTMNMYGGTIRNGTRIVNGWDGAANVSIKANSTLNMYGGTIENSYSDLSGSNIRLNAATSKMNMYGGTIRGGQYAIAGLYGANVYLYVTGAQFNMQGGKITGGEALFGGNICSLGGNITIGGTALIENGSAVCKTDSTGAVVSRGSAYGGNIYANGDAVLTITGGKITGGKITGGPASATTGVYTDSGYGGNIATTAATINISGGVIEGGSSPNGSALFVTGANSSLTVSGGTISGGRAKWGGGIYMADGKLNVSGGTITGASAAFRGGNIYIEGATTVNITGGTISKGIVDKATSSVDRTGGNIYMAGTGKLTISGGTIAGGEAMEGGNLCATNGTVEIAVAAKIKDGLSTYRGGNVYQRGAAAVTVSGGTISGGRAPDGGNVFVENGSFTVSGGTITGGQAYYNNQPQFDASGNLVILGSQYRGGNIFALTDLTISGGTISNGESLVSWGGNIYVQEANLTVTGGTITNGKALGTSDGRGGNIAGKKAVVNIAKRASIQDGKALEGGNIYIETQDSQLNISGGKVSGGKAVSGGNVYLAPYMVMMLSSGEVSNGTAEQGGNIYVGYRGVLQQTAGIISSGACKQASTNDGDIDFDDLVVEIPRRAGGLSDSKYQGADVYLYDSDYAMMGGTVTADAQSNTSSIYTDAGRVYLGGNATVNAGSIHITETGKLRIDNTWAGSASVLFPKTYAPAEKVEVALAANGNVLVAEDYTILFTPGGEYTEGTLRQGVDSNEAFRAVGKDGVIILGKASYAAMIGSTTYQTLEQALEVAKNGDTIVMHAPATLEELYLRMGRTLDLNGYGLIVTGNVTAANQTAHIIDSSNGAGVLDAKKTYCALNRSNQYLPVWIKDAGFRFVIHSFTPKAPTAVQLESLGENAVMFRFNISGAADCLLAKELLDGGADNGVKVKLKMTWTNSSGLPCAQYFTFTEEQVKQYAYNGTVPGSDVRNDWTSHKFRVTVNNARSVTDLKFTAMLVYDDAVQIASDPCDGYTK